MYQSIVIVVHLLAALGVILLVLLQQGKGADAGASFGSGASATVFGSQGTSNFLSRITAVLTAVFFVTSLALAFFASRQADESASMGLPDPSVLEVPAQQETDVPVLDTSETVMDSGSSLDVPAVPDAVGAGE